MTLSKLSTKDLLDGIHVLLGSERTTQARLIAYLIEVEDRRAHLEMACSSLFDFCLRKLRLSEGEAFRRINAARLARRFPVVLEMIASGRIHLSSLVLLRDHLDEANHIALLEGASGKSKSDVQKLIAEDFPRPDVPPTIRKLPERTVSAARSAFPSAPEASLSGLQAPSTEHAAPPQTRAPTEHRARARTAKWDDTVEPLSATRYKVQLTASVSLKDKLERAALLLGSADADLATVIERALDRWIPELEKARFGKTERPRRSRGAKHGYVTRATRREVVARDGERCSFVGANGERCPARCHLELDHRHPRALGGAGDTKNIRLLCRAHNRFAAERIFGKSVIARALDLRRRKQLTERPREAATAVHQGAVRDGAARGTFTAVHEGAPREAAEALHEFMRDDSSLASAAPLPGSRARVAAPLPGSSARVAARLPGVGAQVAAVPRAST